MKENVQASDFYSGETIDAAVSLAHVDVNIDISHGKTAIIITHRLGSTKIADRVVVMDKGKIVDIGTHYELMQRGGLYAEMFNAQANWYSIIPA